MSWEKRARGGRYYTRSRRRNGRVIREYVGSGAIADLAARQDAEDRRRRAARAEADQKLRSRLDEEDRRVDEMCQAGEAIVSGLLLASGYRRHNRGEWRRRREGQRAE